MLKNIEGVKFYLEAYVQLGHVSPANSYEELVSLIILYEITISLHLIRSYAILISVL
jgi:hypothetical protein